MLPDLKCLLPTSVYDDDSLFDAIMAGVASYVLKEFLVRTSIQCVRRRRPPVTSPSAGHRVCSTALQSTEDDAARRVAGSS